VRKGRCLGFGLTLRGYLGIVQQNIDLRDILFGYMNPSEVIWVGVGGTGVDCWETNGVSVGHVFGHEAKRSVEMLHLISNNK